MASKSIFRRNIIMPLPWNRPRSLRPVFSRYNSTHSANHNQPKSIINDQPSFSSWAAELQEKSKHVPSTDAKAPPPIALPPARRLAIVTCMDSRIDPVAQLGLKEGDAHIIRNAGGIAKDALRSLIISQRLMGTREIAVFHHTGCGIVTFSTPSLRDAIKCEHSGNVAVASHVDEIDFMEYGNLEESVRDDVRFLKEHPLVLPETKVTGWIYDVDTRRSTQIV